MTETTRFQVLAGKSFTIEGSNTTWHVPANDPEGAAFEECVLSMDFEEMEEEGWRVVAIDAYLEDEEFVQMDGLLAVREGKLLECAGGDSRELEVDALVAKIDIIVL